MGKIKSILLIFFTCFCATSFSQTLEGIVLDHKTNSPIESASVYFDGTNIGTSTNADGEFKIHVKPGVISPLIISSLGYQKNIVTVYKAGQFYKILLREDINTLDEVVISGDDGMSRDIKLRHFKREFLGDTPNGRSCTILNESDLVLRFDPKSNLLTASSRKPIIVENDHLKYLITFEIQDFVIDFGSMNMLTKKLDVNSVSYSGTSLYKDLDSLRTKKVMKRRERIYEGSVLHFMRALSKKRLKNNNYIIFDGNDVVPTYKFITVEPVIDSKDVQVFIFKRLDILFDKQVKSAIKVDIPSFTIDEYGNYTPIDKIIFGGDMANKRLGDTLPFDYR